MFRDKRVVNGAFVMPVFMIVLFMMLIGFVEQRLREKPDLTIAYVKGEKNLLLQAFEASGKVKLVSASDAAGAKKLLEDGDARLALVFTPGFDAAVTAGSAEVTAYYKEGEPLSSIALSVTQQSIQEINRSRVEKTLETAGLPESLSEPIKLSRVDASPKDGLGGSAIASLLPYLIVLWAFYGGFSIVSDLVAGEKERGTMETLLVSPVRRREIAYGKFFALAVICLTSSLVSLAGVLIVGALGLDITKALFATGMHVSAISLVAMLLLLVPLVLLFSGLMITVSAYARNLREAQTYLTLVSFVVLMPAIFSQFVGIAGAEKSAAVQWTPILNTAVNLKSALESGIEWGPMGIAIITNAVLAVIFAFTSRKMFEKEQIVTRV